MGQWLSSASAPHMQGTDGVARGGHVGGVQQAQRQDLALMGSVLHACVR